MYLIYIFMPVTFYKPAKIWVRKILKSSHPPALVRTKLHTRQHQFNNK